MELLAPWRFERKHLLRSAVSARPTPAVLHRVAVHERYGNNSRSVCAALWSSVPRFSFYLPPLKSASCANSNQEINGCAKGIHTTVPTTTSSRTNQPSENTLPSGAYYFGVVRRISFTFLTPALNPVPMPPRKLMGVPRSHPRRLRPCRLAPADHQRHYCQAVHIICCPLCTFFHFTYPPQICVLY